MPNQQLRAFFEKMDAHGLAVTYSDVRLETDYSEVLPPQVDVSSLFSRRVPLRIPIVSSAMDTVTESRMAIALAVEGGLGIIHKNLDPDEQRRHAKRVKRYLNGRINTPIFVSPEDTLGGIKRMQQEKGFAFHTFPVVDEAGIFLGMLTQKDFNFASDDAVLASYAMTAFGPDFIHASSDATADEVFALMRTHKKSAIPLLDKDGRVAGMYIYTDLQRIRSGQSLNNVDAKGNLRVGAAIGAGKDALLRAELLVKEGCDVLVIDTAHGDSKGVQDVLRSLKGLYPETDIVAGNVSRGESVKRLIDLGADGILIGQGPGSICTTRIVAGIGRPQVSAVYECACAAEESGVPVCADGGIQHPGDISVALAIGARSVILGSLLAGTDESPGEVEMFGQRPVKAYRGMGSLGAMQQRQQSRERYGQGTTDPAKVVPEGVEGFVPYTGPLSKMLGQYVGGLRAGMAYIGAHNLGEFRDRAELFRITGSGLVESHPHDLLFPTSPRS